MIKCNSIKTLKIYLDLSDKTKFRLMKSKTILTQKFKEKSNEKKRY